MKLSENEIIEKIALETLKGYEDMNDLIQAIKNHFGFNQTFQRFAATIDFLGLPKIPFKKIEKLEVIKFTEEIKIKNDLSFSFSLSQNKLITK